MISYESLLNFLNRYQILAGVIEQRILEPLLHNKKILLSVICFAVRTGNTFLGSLMYDLIFLFDLMLKAFSSPS